MIVGSFVGGLSPLIGLPRVTAPTTCCMLLDRWNRTGQDRTTHKKKSTLKMVVRQVGVESTSPCTWVKHIAKLLRNKENSQQYPSVYEDRRTKSIEDIEKTFSKGIASGQKCPWDQRRDQGDFSPRPMPARPAAGLLGESRVNGSLPCQTRLKQH